MSDESKLTPLDDIYAGTEKPAEPSTPATEEVASTAPAEQAETAPAAGSETAEQADKLPEFMDAAYLERHPEDATNWRVLRDTAKDFKASTLAAKAAYEQAVQDKAALRAELDALKTAAATPRTPEPQGPEGEFLDDPDAHIAALEAKTATALRNMELNSMERGAVGVHGQKKVDAAFAQYQAAAAKDPNLAVQMTSAADPWAWMVSEMERRVAMADIGDDPAQFRARIEAETRAKIEAEMVAKLKSNGDAAIEAKIRESLPESLANAPGAGQNAGDKAWQGPESLSDVLGGRLDS